MKIIIRPLLDPQREIDLTERLVAAIAEEISRICGGNAELNRIEAESHLQRIAGAAKADVTSVDLSVSMRKPLIRGTETSPNRPRARSAAASR